MIDTTNKTLQQVSDEIAAALIKQGKQCVDDEGNFVYRDNEGNHCAIGHLLEPNSKTMGSTDILVGILAEFDDDEIGVNNDFLCIHIDPLCYIQSIHDTTSQKTALRYLMMLEQHYSLDISAWSEWIEAMPH